MGMDSKELFPLIDIALAMVKDNAINNALRKVEEAQREYLIANAEANRKKSNEVIAALMKLDIEKLQLKFQFDRNKENLSPKAIDSIQAVLNFLDQKRTNLVAEKNRIGK